MFVNTMACGLCAVKKPSARSLVRVRVDPPVGPGARLPLRLHRERGGDGLQGLGVLLEALQLLLAAQRVRDGDTLNCPVSEVNLFAGKWCGRFVVS